MARPRSIDTNDILDAAEATVIEKGPAKLTLEAVAMCAGISKASVIYDYKSKNELIRAVIERRLACEEQRIDDAMNPEDGSRQSLLDALIKVAAVRPAEERCIANNLSAALAQDDELTNLINGYYHRLIAQVEEVKEHPRGALLAFLALEGLKMLEMRGFHEWPPEERERILADIAWLAESDPAPACPQSGSATDQS